MWLSNCVHWGTSIWGFIRLLSSCATNPEININYDTLTMTNTSPSQWICMWCISHIIIPPSLSTAFLCLFADVQVDLGARSSFSSMSSTSPPSSVFSPSSSSISTNSYYFLVASCWRCQPESSGGVLNTHDQLHEDARPTNHLHQHISW